MQRNTMTASSLIGHVVQNARGERLGKIEDIMLDMSTGRVAYGILSLGVSGDVRNKLFAVPWQRISVDIRARELMLNEDRQHMAKAPGFPKDRWPDFADRRMMAEVDRFYGVQPGT